MHLNPEVEAADVPTSGPSLTRRSLLAGAGAAAATVALAPKALASRRVDLTPSSFRDVADLASRLANGPVHLGRGTYRFDNTLRLPEGAKLTAHAQARIVPGKANIAYLVHLNRNCEITGGEWHANNIADSSTSSLYTVRVVMTNPAVGSPARQLPVNGTKIRNASFQNRNGQRHDRPPTAIRLIGDNVNDGRHSIVENCSFRQYYICVQANGMSYLTIRNNAPTMMIDAVPRSSLRRNTVNGRTRWLAPANTGGAQFVLLGMTNNRPCNNVTIEGNENPLESNNTRILVLNQEVGGHMIATTLPAAAKHQNIVVRNNTFHCPDQPWAAPRLTSITGQPSTTGQYYPIANGATGDVIAMKGVNGSSRVSNNRVYNSGEFGITVVQGSYGVIVENNIIDRSDGCAIAIGGHDTQQFRSPTVAVITVRNNTVLNAGLDRWGDLQGKTPSDTNSRSTNYPNARAALRIWNAHSVNVTGNRLDYTSSAIWIKSADWQNAPQATNSVHNLTGSGNSANPVRVHVPGGGYKQPWTGKSQGLPKSTLNPVIVEHPGGWSGNISATQNGTLVRKP